MGQTTQLVEDLHASMGVFLILPGDRKGPVKSQPVLKSSLALTLTRTWLWSTIGTQWLALVYKNKTCGRLLV